jgi:glycosyltransferase involved in cell wall biosynthesis
MPDTLRPDEMPVDHAHLRGPRFAPEGAMQMQPGLVSVMMPAYNAERFIRQAVESLLSQTYPEWELIVVNDGSTDRTAEIARAFGDPRIHVVNQANSGEAAARNTCLERMRGEYVAFLDADDLYLPRHLELAVGLLQVNLDFDAVYSDGHYCDEAGTLLQPLSSRRLEPAEGRIFEQVVRASSMLGPPVCVVLRRNLLLQRGFRFDSGLRIGPDWDLFVRYAEVGKFKYIDQKTCLYRLHETNITTSLGYAKRAADLARCRRRATQLRSFNECSVSTRVAVFHDLLVDLLLGKAAEQTEITQGAEFARLPDTEQARLLRLMATKAIRYVNGDNGLVAQWLHRSRLLNPRDHRTIAIHLMHRVSPSMCRLMLAAKCKGDVDPRIVPPFWDVKLSRTPARANTACNPIEA